MVFKLTRKVQYSKKCKDGKYRNFLIFFLNGIEIIKQKLPFDENGEKGYDRRTAVYDVFILDGKIHQTRKSDVYCYIDCTDNIRSVSFPLSKKILEELSVPKNLKICEE